MPDGYLYTSAQRNAILEDIWNFRCDCDACSGNPLRNISDLRRTLLFGLQAMLIGDSGRLANYDIALSATKGRGSCTVDAHPSNLDDAQKTQFWWLTSQLLEAEGIYDEMLGHAYAQAFTSLQARMLALGVANTPPTPLEAYCRNIKDWMKATLDIFKVSRRSNGHIVYAGPGEEGVVLKNVSVDCR
jgi:hypothetical protein